MADADPLRAVYRNSPELFPAQPAPSGGSLIGGGVQAGSAASSRPEPAPKGSDPLRGLYDKSPEMFDGYQPPAGPYPNSPELLRHDPDAAFATEVSRWEQELAGAMSREERSRIEASMPPAVKQMLGDTGLLSWRPLMAWLAGR